MRMKESIHKLLNEKNLKAKSDLSIKFLDNPDNPEE
jgi:hypothetical protein